MHELLHFYEFNICDTNSLSWITKNLFTLDPDRQMGWGNVIVAVQNSLCNTVTISAVAAGMTTVNIASLKVRLILAYKLLSFRAKQPG